MNQETALAKIQDFVELFIRKWPEVFWVDASLNASGKLTILLDADNGMNIEKCADVNRALYKFVESERLFGENNFSIEVSSPGIDRPLKLLRQFKKNIGRNVEVVKSDNNVLVGKLLQADSETITIEKEEKSKKKQTEKILINIPFTDIRQVKVLILF